MFIGGMQYKCQKRGGERLKRIDSRAIVQKEVEPKEK